MRTMRSTGTGARLEEPHLLLDAVLVDGEVGGLQAGARISPARPCTLTLSATSADAAAEDRSAGAPGMPADGSAACANADPGVEDQGGGKGGGNFHDDLRRPSAAIDVPCELADSARNSARPSRTVALHVYVTRAECVAEVRRVAVAELLPRVGVALPAEMLERVGRGHTAEPAADFEVGAGRQPLEEPAAERVADAGRIDDADAAAPPARRRCASP